MSIGMVSNPPHGGGHGGFRGGVYRQGMVPWNSFGYVPPWNYGYGWPWSSPYYYGAPYPISPFYTATPVYAPVVPGAASSTPGISSPCCYDSSTKALSCPGSSLHGAPAAVVQRSQWQGRTIVLVNSPAFTEDRWLWEC